MRHELENKIAKYKHLVEQQQNEIQNLKKAIFGMSNYVYWKNKDGIYLGETPTCMEYRVEKGATEDLYSMVGKKDNDFFIAATAEEYRDNDLVVMESGSSVVAEESMVLDDGKVFPMVSLKSPIIDENKKIVGVLGQTIDMSLAIPNDVANFISFPPGESAINKLKFFMMYSFLLSGDASDGGQCREPLTLREKEVAYYLLKGKSVKGIGAALNISPRTVERHMDHMKEKLRCYNKSHLVDKLFSLCITLFE